MQSAQRRAAAGPTGVLGAGLSSRPGTRQLRARVGGGPRRRQQLLSAETHRQAVPRVRVLFPPPASAVILVVPPVPHGGPHASTAHRAVAAALAVAVRALHGQLHATVLLKRQRETVTGGRPGDQAPRPRGPVPAPASSVPGSEQIERLYLRESGTLRCHREKPLFPVSESPR